LSNWATPLATGPVTGSVVIPGSKSASARSLVLAALAQTPATLTGVLDSRDTTLMRAGLTALGAQFVDLDEHRLQVHPIDQAAGGGRVDVGLAGTVLRFLPPVAVLAAEPTQFTGDPGATRRPIAPLLLALTELGATVTPHPSLPFSIAGSSAFAGGEVRIDASSSSQFISALLLAAARYRDGITVRHSGSSLPSRPHIDMTCTMLAQHGVEVDRPDEFTWQVRPGPITAVDAPVEPDLTNAATFLAAAMVTGGQVSTAWPADSVQAGDALANVLAAFGATLTYTDSVAGRQLTVSAPNGVIGTEIDLHQVSELTPVVAALAAVADGPSEIRGVAHIRGHETDRLAALATELDAVGTLVTQTADGLKITPGPRRPAVFHTHADHRMAHAGALIGLVTPGIELDDVSCTTKTLPDFPGLWTRLLHCVA
jgi:3-phosphoshikimate 1-carboxyvinyltransferase